MSVKNTILAVLVFLLSGALHAQEDQSDTVIRVLPQKEGEESLTILNGDFTGRHQVYWRFASRFRDFEVKGVHTLTVTPEYDTGNILVERSRRINERSRATSENYHFNVLQLARRHPAWGISRHVSFEARVVVLPDGTAEPDAVAVTFTVDTAFDTSSIDLATDIRDQTVVAVGEGTLYLTPSITEEASVPFSKGSEFLVIKDSAFLFYPEGRSHVPWVLHQVRDARGREGWVRSGDLMLRIGTIGDHGLFVTKIATANPIEEWSNAEPIVFDFLLLGDANDVVAVPLGFAPDQLFRVFTVDSVAPVESESGAYRVNLLQTTGLLYTSHGETIPIEITVGGTSPHAIAANLIRVLWPGSGASD